MITDAGMRPRNGQSYAKSMTGSGSGKDSHMSLHCSIPSPTNNSNTQPSPSYRRHSKKSIVIQGNTNGRSQLSTSDASLASTSCSTLINTSNVNNYSNQTLTPNDSKDNAETFGSGHNNNKSSQNDSYFNHKHEAIMCLVCKRKLCQPKLLSCLHVFCKMCLQSHYQPGGDVVGDMIGFNYGQVTCPRCQQATEVPGPLGLDSLDDDYVMHNMLDMLAIEEMQLDCTSCKTDETKAVARCSECAEFLCTSCVSAHQHMRCFESHHVIKFDEITGLYRRNLARAEEIEANATATNAATAGTNSASSSNRSSRAPSLNGANSNKSPSSMSTASSSSSSSLRPNLMDGGENGIMDEIIMLNDKIMRQQQRSGSKGPRALGNGVPIDCGVPIHKPLYCKTHPRENLKFFCNSCQMPICSECVVGAHQQPGHQYERIADAEQRSIDELETLVRRAHDTVNNCHLEYQALDQYLLDLQEELESNRNSIDEAHQAYQALLDRVKEELQKELDQRHTEKEFYIMSLHKSIETAADKLNDAIRFSERVFRNGNSSEILLLKRPIVAQIKRLLGSLPRTDTIDVSVKFVTDENKFEQAVRASFGRFYTQKELKQNYLNNLTNYSQQNQPKNLMNEFDHQMRPTDLYKNQFGSIGNNNNLLDNNNCLPDDMLLDMAKSASLDTQLQLKNLMALQQQMGTKQSQQVSQLHSSLQQPVQFMNMMNGLDGLAAASQPSHHFMPVQQIPVQKAASSEMINSFAGTYSNGSHLINNFNSLDLISGLSQQHQHSNSGTPVPFPIGSKFGSTGTANMLTTNLSDLASLTDLNHGMNGFGQLGTSAGLPNGAGLDTHSNPSPSPPAMLSRNIGPIGSGLSGTNSANSVGPSNSVVANFTGNGNLNPPVRQNGKMTNMQVKDKFGTLGAGKSQFNSPHGFCLGLDEEIIVADTNNHRIQVFDKESCFKYAFGSPGREEGQLWYPRKVAVMRDSGKFVICDRGNERSRMQIFNKNGHFLKKINIRYIDIVAGLAINSHNEIIAVDSVSPTVFRISSETGDLIKWFDCSDHMREPSDIAVSRSEYYVCDFKGHCVVVFNEEGSYLRRIGGENITNFPNGIDVSDAGDVLIGDSHGNRFHIAVFTREGQMISEFECPYVKVSRCCGLKLTSEGYVVTLAKNNHHVLVLNTLYVN